MDDDYVYVSEWAYFKCASDDESSDYWRAMWRFLTEFNCEN